MMMFLIVFVNDVRLCVGKGVGVGGDGVEGVFFEFRCLLFGS